MITVPEWALLPKIPVKLARLHIFSINSSGKDGYSNGKCPKSLCTGTPAISQWPDMVSFPALISSIQPYLEGREMVGLEIDRDMVLSEAILKHSLRPNFSRLGISNPL